MDNKPMKMPLHDRINNLPTRRLALNFCFESGAPRLWCVFAQ